MRCNNCGFENANDAAHCIKCKTALEVVPAVQAASGGQRAAAFAGTITDAQMAGRIISNALVNCPYPDCGYPYASQLPTCPRCKRPGYPPVGGRGGGAGGGPAGAGPGGPGAFGAAEAGATVAGSADALAGPVGSGSPSVEPSGDGRSGRGGGAAGGPVGAGFAAGGEPEGAGTGNEARAGAVGRPGLATIDPYRAKAPAAAEPPPPPVCYLLPVSKEDEPGAREPVVLTLGGESPAIELNRDNLDPANPSITGKLQAELSFENGAWQIMDRSPLQTTFIQVAKQTPLKEGDILLFGDRKFIFSLTGK